MKKEIFKKMIKYFFMTLLVPAISQAMTECVQVFYDRGPKDYWIGHANAVFMQNLLGHFPHLQQFVSPIENYKKGALNRCKASFYIGTHFDAKIPEVFHTDFIETKKMWPGWDTEFGTNLRSCKKYLIIATIVRPRWIPRI